MSVYVFNTEAIQSLSSVICFHTSKELLPPLMLQITFRNFFLKDYDAWDRSADGEISIEKIVDTLTQNVLSYEKFPFIAQLDIRCRCYDYLRTNNLLRYPNVIPFQSVPYRMPSFSKDWPNQMATIIPFPPLIDS